jgi:hypothetical protein
MEYELYHAGVKGMKWGVRKKIAKTSQSVKRLGRSISAANIEEQRRRIERSIARNKSKHKHNGKDYSAQNARHRAKLRRLAKMRDKKISDLSEYDIDRGRTAYKTMKNVSMSVAVTAAAAVAGSVYAPAAVATKIAGSALTSALKED